MKHVIAFSGGKDSTALAIRLAEVEPRADYVGLCTPTGDEADDFFEHLKMVADRVGLALTPVMHPLGLHGLIEQQACIPNFRMRFCTRMLKIEPCRRWLLGNGPAILYVGLRADEEARPGGEYGDITGVEVRYPLREWGWDEGDVWDYLKEKGFREPGDLPLFDRRQGTPFPARTDCDLCFWQRIDQWYRLWRDKPEKYAKGEEHEARTGHTFRSAGRDTWPASLVELRKEFESGRVPKKARDPFAAQQCRVCRL